LTSRVNSIVYDEGLFEKMCGMGHAYTHNNYERESVEEGTCPLFGKKKSPLLGRGAGVRDLSLAFSLPD
jgi:hypothetical protein